MAQKGKSNKLKAIRDDSVEGQARFKDSENEGKLQVKFSIF